MTKSFDPREMKLKDRYGLLTRIVAPRPIALVSSLASDGTGNLAPFSFFALGGANPPSCAICPVSDREGNTKNTLDNIRANGEYVVNAVTRDMADAVNQCSWAYPRDVDEIDQVNLSRELCRVVAPPRISQSPVALECRAFEIVDHGDGPLASHWVIGEILAIHVDEAVMTDGLPDNTKIEHLARLGEEFYTSIDAGNLIKIPKPTKP